MLQNYDKIISKNSLTKSWPYMLILINSFSVSFLLKINLTIYCILCFNFQNLTPMHEVWISLYPLTLCFCNLMQKSQRAEESWGKRFVINGIAFPKDSSRIYVLAGEFLMILFFQNKLVKWFVKFSLSW